MIRGTVAGDFGRFDYAVTGKQGCGMRVVDQPSNLH